VNLNVRRWTKTILIVIFAAAIATLHYKRFPEAGQGTDFPQLYCAAKIVGAGMGHRLYDVALQWQFQQRYTGRIGNFFIHPPFEALLYLPFTVLPLRAAYFAWTLFNLGILGWIAWLFHRGLRIPVAAEFIYVLLVSSVPVSLSLFQGQDSILLLLVFTLACIAVTNGRGFEAGCFLALGLFKFQFALPALLIFLVGRKSKVVAAGFSILAAVLIAISLWIAGWSSFSTYPRLLLDLDHIPFNGVHSGSIPNFRGALTMLFRQTSVMSWIAVGGFSLIAIAAAAVGWRRTESVPGAGTLALSNVVLAAVLCSYQASPHDLALTLIPIFLTYAYVQKASDMPQNRRILFLATLLVLFLPLLHVYALRMHLYVLLVVPLAILLLLNTLEIRRIRGMGAGKTTSVSSEVVANQST
jgi:hypothetical protein